MPRLREPDKSCLECHGRGLVDHSGQIEMCRCVQPRPKAKANGRRKPGRPRATDYVLVGCGATAHVPDASGEATLCGVSRDVRRAKRRTDWTGICDECRMIRKKLGRDA